MNYPRLAFLSLPYARLELPGWRKLLKKFKVLKDFKDDELWVKDDQLWENAPIKTIRGKWHDYLMELDLSNWSERITYFLGRYYDLPTQLFIRAAVKPGDSFIDIGANLGMITLLAAYHVGAKGIVYSFEPNPVAFKRLEATILTNHLKQVIYHQCGLSNQQAELVLNVLDKHTGSGTLSKIPEQYQSNITQQCQVPIYRGDDILPKQFPGTLFIKIDVEGFEPYVLQGLSQTISAHKPAILTEVIEGHLKNSGSSASDLFCLMQDFGYQAFNMKAKSFIYHRLQLSEVLNSAHSSFNVLWLHPQNCLVSRLQPWIISTQKS